MKISIVILNWNRPQDTMVATESCLAQDYDDVEILLWDNKSSDNSLQLLEEKFEFEDRVTIHAANTNHGVAGGRNRAFAKTKGAIILSLDSDAFFEHNDALQKIATRLQNEPAIGAMSFEVKRPDGHLMWPFSRPADTWQNRTFKTMRVDGCSFAVPKAVFEKTNGFAEHFSPYGAEDQHFAYQIIRLGLAIEYMPSISVVHAFAPHGRTGKQFRYHVRNSILTPLELFPMPHALLSTGKIMLSLFRDAIEQKQPIEYIKGVLRALSDFRKNNRKPMPLSSWKMLRSVIGEDKALAKVNR